MPLDKMAGVVRKKKFSSDLFYVFVCKLFVCVICGPQGGTNRGRKTVMESLELELQTVARGYWPCGCWEPLGSLQEKLLVKREAPTF